MKELIKDAREKVALQLETEIRCCIQEDWSVEEIKRRCRWTKSADSLVEILYVDNKPVLEVHPIETNPELQEDKVLITVTQKIRRL